MSDQLAGQWYANLTGLGDIVPVNMRVSALKKIFEFNVMKFAAGGMGALNGMASDGHVLKDNEQIQEVWVGTTFGLCGEMVAEGLREEAFTTAKAFMTWCTKRKVIGSGRRRPGAQTACIARACTCARARSGQWK